MSLEAEGPLPQSESNALNQYCRNMLPLFRPAGRWKQGFLRNLMPPSHQTVLRWKEEASIQRNTLYSMELPLVPLVSEAHALVLQAFDEEIEAFNCLMQTSREKRNQWPVHLEHRNKLMAEFVLKLEIIYELAELTKAPLPGEDPCLREKVEAWEKFTGRLVTTFRQDKEIQGVSSGELIDFAMGRASLANLIQPPPCLQRAHNLFLQAMSDYASAVDAAAKHEPERSNKLGRQAVEKIAESANELSQVKAQRHWR